MKKVIFKAVTVILLVSVFIVHSFAATGSITLSDGTSSMYVTYSNLVNGNGVTLNGENVNQHYTSIDGNSLQVDIYNNYYGFLGGGTYTCNKYIIKELSPSSPSSSSYTAPIALIDLAFDGSLTEGTVTFVVPLYISAIMSATFNNDPTKPYEESSFDINGLDFLNYGTVRFAIGSDVLSPTNIEYYSGYGFLCEFALSKDIVKKLNNGFSAHLFAALKSDTAEIPVDLSVTSSTSGVKIYTGYRYTTNRTIYYTQGVDGGGCSCKELIPILQSIDNKLGSLEDSSNNIDDAIARLQTSIDLLAGQLSVSNNTFADLVENQKQTNEYLTNKLSEDVKTSVSEAIDQAAEIEKNEATEAGDKAVADVQNAIDEVVPIDQYKDAVQDFSKSFVSSSTVSLWSFPELYIPAIPALGNTKIALSSAVDINLSQAYIQYVPETIRLIVGNVLGAGLVYYLIKEVMSLSTYMLDNKGGGDVDE